MGYKNNYDETLLKEIQQEFPYGATVLVQGIPSAENNFLPKQFGGEIYYLEKLNAFFIKWDGAPMTDVDPFEE